MAKANNPTDDTSVAEDVVTEGAEAATAPVVEETTPVEAPVAEPAPVVEAPAVQAVDPAPVADVAPVVVPENAKTIVLTHEFQNNTPEGIVKYGPGEVTVEAGIADDLVRRQKEYNDYLTSVHVRTDATINAGTISGNGS